MITLIVGLVPVFYAKALPSSRLNAAAREMSALIRYARSLARIHGEQQVLTIDLDSGHYGIEGRAPKSIPPDVGIKVVDPFTGEVQRGQYRLIFQSPGGMPAGIIALWNNKREVKIELDPVVGAVVIKQ